MPKTAKNRRTGGHSKNNFKEHAAAAGALIILIAILFSSRGVSSTSNPTSNITTAQATARTAAPLSLIAATNFSSPTNFLTSNSGNLNITFTVFQDLALGNYGYWAIGNYTKHILAKQIGNNSYLAVVTANGTWVTVTGAKSPNYGAPEGRNGSGTFQEIYYAQIPGSLNTSVNAHGFVGAFNFGGTTADLLVSAANQSDPDSFNWIAAYFNTTSEYINVLNETYVFRYQNQTYLYVRNLNGSTYQYGDIIT